MGRVYVSWSGPIAKVSVIDMTTKQVIQTLTAADNPKIPFNEDWGKQEIAIQNEKNKSRPFKMVNDPDFPEFFPPCRNLFVPGDGRVYFERWSGTPNKRGPLLVWDEQGQAVQSSLRPESLERIVVILKGMAYVLTFDDEEAGLARVPVEQIEAFVQAHPIIE
ncbi:MAG: hypothetical protein H6510_08645 [Acidobacteria bacterium]|nr:hypothetical protein [Acidobacteriota bacterium]MCB9397870.1 hypothetical protein [Acidobacteriota bacterium]